MPTVYVVGVAHWPVSEQLRGPEAEVSSFCEELHNFASVLENARNIEVYELNDLLFVI